MKILRNLLYFALFLALPLVASAAVPTLKIISPSKSSTTSGTLNASGIAAPSKDAVTGINYVFYSLNNGPWTEATGTTTWNATNLSLIAGENTFAAYAVDQTAQAASRSNSPVPVLIPQYSKTNTVTFLYIVEVPITLNVSLGGTVKGVTDGELLQVGKLIKASAKADKGFAFSGWTGGITSLSPKISFVMASNFVLNATFADSTRPACVIVFPAVKQSLSNSPINLTGRASDNLAVASVHYQFNNGGWNTATLTGGGNWEADNLFLIVGANVAQAYASDTAGNLSLTNTVNFTYVSNAPPPPPPPASIAPASLNRLIAQLNLDDENPFEISFGLNTYALADTNDLNNASVGNYTYTVISTNQALLNATGALPPYDFGAQHGLILTFTSSTNATVVTGGNVTGTMNFVPAPSNFSYAVPPSIIFSIETDSYFGTTNSLLFNSGSFTNTDGATGNNSWGNYTYGLFSPAGAEAVEFFQDPADASNSTYFQMEFFNQAGGVYIANTFDSSLNFLGGDVGSFQVTSLFLQPTGLAPDSVSGEQWIVTSNGKTFTLDLDENSLTESGSSADNNFVGNYTYVKTGADTAQFQNVQVAPPNGQGSGAIIDITFKSATAATFSRTSNGQTTTGSAKISHPAAVAPTTLASKIITAKLGAHTSTITLQSNGTFTKTTTGVGGQDFGSYAYTPYSPNGGVITLHTTSGPDISDNSFAVLTFTTATAGNIAFSDFDIGGAPLDATLGTFTVQ